MSEAKPSAERRVSSVDRRQAIGWIGGAAAVATGLGIAYVAVDEGPGLADRRVSPVVAAESGFEGEQIARIEADDGDPDSFLVEVTEVTLSEESLPEEPDGFEFFFESERGQFQF